MARPKRYANEAEKQAAYRLRKKGGVSLDLGKEEAVVQAAVSGIEIASKEIPEIVTVAKDTSLPMTATDEKFEAQQPQYFIYLKDVKKRKCRKCDKGFETRLELNQFCSPKCKTEFLKQFQTFGRAHE